MRIPMTLAAMGRTPVEQVVLVDGDDTATAADLAAALGGTDLSVDGRPVAATARLGVPPLLAGAVVALDGAPQPLAAASPWELWVLHGPDAGARRPVPLGRTVLGRAEDAGVRLFDPLVSRRHAVLEATASGAVSVHDAGGSNGTWADGVRLGAEPWSLTEGDVVDVGSTRLVLRRAVRGRRPGRPDGAGHLVVPSGPAGSPDLPVVVRLPDPPATPRRSPFPLVALLVPLALAAVLAAVMRSPTMLLFGLTGPVLSITTWWSERRRHRREHRPEADERDAALDRVERERRRERDRVLARHRSLAEVLLTVEHRLPALWHTEHEEVRLGTGPRPSAVVVEGPDAPPLPPHEDAPVSVDLARSGALAVCGPPSVVRSVVSGVVLRLAVGLPPSRLRIVLAGDHGPLGPDLVSWLPHVEPAPPADPEPDRVEWLLDEVGRREEAGHLDRPRAPPGAPRVVLVLDGPHTAHPALVGLLRRGPAVGVTVLLGAASRREVPPDVPVLEVDAQGRGRWDGRPLGVDVPGGEWVTRVGRALAPLREAGPEERGTVPDAVRLLDLVGEVDGSRVAERWRRGPSTTSAVLGATAGGPLAVDLALDGPHALVGGTTGSGKSELLQTLVASLALGNRPDELGFLLVDYKGGAAFRGCVDLPHVLGVVTDLDGHLTARALASLQAEIRRRERLLAGAGVADLDAYRRTRGPDRPALARLVIVIDEFRVLAEELPDFVHGLVRIAATGRSLGVHLVLATQRPGGIVSADIRANVSLRIALRVRDRTESLDILDAPDAAAIDARTPGRADLRGAATPVTRFQSARVTSGPTAVRRLRVLPAHGCATTDGPADGPEATTVDAGPTDLDRIVGATREATRTLGIRPPASPWLPPLPDRLPLVDLPRVADGPAIGLEDDPAGQTQRPWVWRIADGHLGIAGGPRSGRTAAAAAVVRRLVQEHGPDEVHLYVLGPRSSAWMDGLPHVGAVADLSDAEHARLVVDHLRRLLLRGRGAARPVLVVDGWERLADLEQGALAAEVRSLLDGAAETGLRAVVTGGRSILSGQLAQVLAQRLVLRVVDPVDLAMASIPARAVPVHQPPGRALDARTHREVQVAWSDGDADPVAGQAKTGSPARVLRLPEVVPLPTSSPADLLVLGARDGDLAWCGLRPDAGERRLVVIGPPGSGRTTALRALAHGLSRTGAPLAVLGRSRPAFDAPAVRALLVIDGTDPADVDRLVAARRAEPSLAVLVDDAERLAGQPLEPVLLEIARRADEDRGLVVASTTEHALAGRVGALAPELVRARTGLVLWPGPASLALLGAGSTRYAANGPRVPGRGLLVTPRGTDHVQVATAVTR